MITFIKLNKGSSAEVVSCKTDDKEFSVYQCMSNLVGEQGELCVAKVLSEYNAEISSPDYMLMYDDAYGWDKTEEDFKRDFNACASALAGHPMYSTCVITKVIENDGNCNSEFVSLTDNDISFLKECLAKIYSKDIQWKD